jgi:hypothetical protein
MQDFASNNGIQHSYHIQLVGNPTAAVQGQKSKYQDGARSQSVLSGTSVSAKRSSPEIPLQSRLAWSDTDCGGQNGENPSRRGTRRGGCNVLYCLSCCVPARVNSNEDVTVGLYVHAQQVPRVHLPLTWTKPTYSEQTPRFLSIKTTTRPFSPVVKALTPTPATAELYLPFSDTQGGGCSTDSNRPLC